MILGLLLAALLGGAQEERHWCDATYPSIGATRIVDMLGNNLQPGNGLLHLVRWDLQPAARMRLDRSPVVTLGPKEAAAMLGPGERLRTSGPVLLVRGGAFAGTDEAEAKALIVQARYNPDARLLLMESYQLTNAAPSYRKIALLLEFSEPVEKLAVWCTADR